ncbi:helix-turn-helix transcriptional regulator [Cellulomonas endometrii]|uniref:helix-turn-helix transcriptional regulator n=1 Tax=Cellulomonas endometrii TaxID=3036301 RepID=UPI003D15636B
MCSVQAKPGSPSTRDAVERAFDAWWVVDRVHLSQSELADGAGVSRRTISKLESDEGLPRRAYVIAWAFATGVQLHWIQTGLAETPAQGDPDGGCALCARRDSNPQPSDP